MAWSARSLARQNVVSRIGIVKSTSVVVVRFMSAPFYVAIGQRSLDLSHASFVARLALSHASRNGVFIFKGANNVPKRHLWLRNHAARPGGRGAPRAICQR
jgi:hypothetical protein